jgi:hypothetical protein
VFYTFKGWFERANHVQIKKLDMPLKNNIKGYNNMGSLVPFGHVEQGITSIFSINMQKCIGCNLFKKI